MSYRLVMVVLALVLVAAMGASLMVGPAALSPSDLLSAFGGGGPAWIRSVVLEVRLPRVLLAALGGVALALSGHALQGLFRNPLADPSVLGVASGATLGAVVALYSGLALSILVVPSAAFVSALATAATVYRLAARGPVVSTAALVLAGLAVSALTSALSSLVLSVALADWELGRQLLSWMLGGLENRTLDHVLVLAPLALVPSLALAFYARDLDALALGEEQALAVGVDVLRVRRGVLVLSSLLTAATVSVMGIVPFVGLVVPHASRLLSGPGHQKSFVTSALLGALLLVLADTVSRALSGSLDLRPGVLTSLIGGPFFVALVLRARKQDEVHA